MIVGSNYGLNSKWINRRNQEGFYPLFNDQWPQRFYIMDQEGEGARDRIYKYEKKHAEFLHSTGQLDPAKHQRP